jgi:hypothetical protein
LQCFLLLSCFQRNLKNVTDSSKKTVQSPDRNLWHKSGPELIVGKCYSNTVIDTTDTAPLIVIDNYLYEGSLADLKLKPSEIKSITILTDAPVNAIWCNRRTRGVIVIYTIKKDSILLSKSATKKAKAIDTITSKRSNSLFIVPKEQTRSFWKRVNFFYLLLF